MYSLLLETYIKDPAEKSRLFHAIDTIPAVTRKAEWAMKWIQRFEHPLLFHVPTMALLLCPAAVHCTACDLRHMCCAAVLTVLLSAL